MALPARKHISTGETIEKMTKKETENNKEQSYGGWDWQTKALHWINAILIISLIILILGYEGLEDINKDFAKKLELLHIYAGHIFAVTFTLRVIWGFIGNKYARFSDMIPRTKEKIQGIKENIKWYMGGCKTTPPHYKGHNPLASLFYLALFVILGLQVATGITLAGIEHDFFPGTLIASLVGKKNIESLEDFAEELHEFGFGFILFFIVAHLVGLIAHYAHDKGKQIKAMWFGSK